MNDPVRILFVCSGNICRSPMAEAIARHQIAARGLTGQIVVDSAGTGHWHEGEDADQRTLAVLGKKGIEPPSCARQIRARDLNEHDYIIAMDESHVESLFRMPGSDRTRISLLLEWDANSGRREVPDPYYGLHGDFETMYTMLDQAVAAMLDAIVEEYNLVEKHPEK